MKMFDNNDKTLRDIKLALEKLVTLNEQIALNTMHVHNLQHGIIQQLFNLNLNETYRALGPESIMQFVYDNVPIRMFLPNGTIDLIQSDILRYRSFFHVESLEMIKQHVPMQGKRVLDIGAYIGNHTVFFAKICGAAEVDSFEPVRPSFEALKRNVSLNNIQGRQYNVGVGARAAMASANINLTNGGGNSLDMNGEGPIKIVAIDELDLAPYAFMKIDVEGMAQDVLLGARNSIATNRPIIVIEAFPHEFHNVNQTLVSFGYQKHATASDDHVYLPN